MFLSKLSKRLIKSSIFRFKASFSGLLAEEATIIECKDEIVYFKNFQPNILKYQSLLRTKDQESLVFLLSLNEKVSCGPLVKKIKSQEASSLKEKQLELINSEENLEFLRFSEENMGEILDFQGNVLENEKTNEKTEKNTAFNYKIQDLLKAEVNIPRRKGTDGQIWTGNLAIDYSTPLAKGNYIVFKGEPSTGKTHVAGHIIKNFITGEENQVYNSNFRKTKAVYVTQNITNAKKMRKFLCDNSVGSENFVIFSPEQNASLLEKFLVAFSAAKIAKSFQKDNCDVLFVLDDVIEHFYREHQLFNAMNQPFSPLKICNELSTVSGCFQNGSFTSLLILETNEPQPEFYKSMENFKNNVESLADIMIDFDLADDVYRHIKPKIDFDINRNVNPWQTLIMRILTEQLRGIMEKLRDEKISLEGKKELKIQIDPWDAYFFLDSTYFMKLLINKRFYTPLESLILVRFTLKAIEEDTVSLFKDEPDILIEKLFAFCKKYKEFDGKDIFSFLKEKIITNINDPNITAFVFENLSRLCELFFVNLKMSDSLLPFKKDYFK